MDIYRLDVDLKFVNRLGETLSTEEKTFLHVGLMRILKEENVDQVLFWGRIRGVQKDYYLAVGLVFHDQYEFPTRRFYWSTSQNFAFKVLPPIIPEFSDTAEDYRNYFTGNPETILYNKKADGEEGENAPAEEAKQEVDSLADSEDLEEAKNRRVPPDVFKEIDRLAYVVRAIENDCSIVPCGAFKLTPTHELRYDDNFEGLAPNEIDKMACWQHFRPPQNSEVQKRIMQEDAIFLKKFLDPIEDDVPKGCWSLQKDLSHSVVLMNHSWPGFLAYHQAFSNQYGYCYFGSGQKNSDLPFLI